MVSSPGRGPIKSQLWAVLSTHWLIRFLSVFYMSASPMQNLYQVHLSLHVWIVALLGPFCTVLTLFPPSAPLTALVIFRDIGLIAAVFWVRYKTVPPPVRQTSVQFEFGLKGAPWEHLNGGFSGKKHFESPFIFLFQVTLSKFFNPCYTTAQLKPTLFSKVTNTHTYTQIKLPTLLILTVFYWNSSAGEYSCSALPGCSFTGWSSLSLYGQRSSAVFMVNHIYFFCYLQTLQYPYCNLVVTDVTLQTWLCVWAPCT